MAQHLNVLKTIPDAKIEEDELDISIGSSSSQASSVHEMIVSETERRKQRLERFREKRRLQYRHDNISSLSDQKSVPSVVGNTKNGIMTVRTIEESLDGNVITEMRRKRRKAFLHYKKKGKGPESPMLKSKNSSHNGTSISSPMKLLKEFHLDDNTPNDITSSAKNDDICGDDDLSVMTSSTSVSVSSAIVDLSVKFTDCTIREFEVIPGSNPSVSAGAPIELGWAHTEDEIVPVDTYEEVRGASRRLQAQMRMPTEYRHQLLMEFGHSMNQIRQADREAHALRIRRLQTIQVWQTGGSIQKEEKLEKMKKALLKPFQIHSRKKKKREEKLLWASLRDSIAIQRP